MRKAIRSSEDKSKSAVIEAVLNIVAKERQLENLRNSPKTVPPRNVSLEVRIGSLVNSINHSKALLRKHGLDPEKTVKQATKVLKKKRSHWSKVETGGPGVYGMGNTPKFWKG